MARLPDPAEVESEPIRIERAGEPVVRVTAAPRRRGCGSTPGPPAGKAPRSARRRNPDRNTLVSKTLEASAAITIRYRFSAGDVPLIRRSLCSSLRIRTVRDLSW